MRHFILAQFCSLRTTPFNRTLYVSEIKVIFGNRQDFAIEAMVEAHLTAPSPLWGRMRVWVAGSQFGDIDDPHCSLFPAYQSFEEMVEKIDELYDPELLATPLEQVYTKVDQALYGVWDGDELVDTEYDEESQKYWRHNFLTNWGEMFDRTEKSYIFKISGDELMVIQPKNNESTLGRYCCSIAQFKSAVKQFLLWHDEEGNRLSGKDV